MRQTRLTAWLLALLMLLATAVPALAAADAAATSPATLQAEQEWYNALDFDLTIGQGQPETLESTVSIKANTARLHIENHGIRKLSVAINGTRLQLNRYFPTGRGEAVVDLSPFIQYGDNTLTIQPLGPPGATANLTVEVPTFNARILHINDIHAKIDQLPKVASYVKAARSEGGTVYLINAGDNFSGGPVSDLNQGKPMIELLNAIGTDLIAVGNHDFDHGPAATRQREEESNFPWLSANTAVADAAATPIQGYPPYRVFTNDLGQKIAFIGLTETPPATALKNQVGLRFDSPTETAQRYIDELRDDVNVVALVSHNGHAYDMAMARTLTGVDLIIGAHSHTYLAAPVVENGVPIVQVGSDARWIGDLRLRQAETVTLVGAAPGGAHTVTVADLKTEEPAVKAIVDGWNQRMAAQLDLTLGTTASALSNADRYLYDIGLGNLITDAMRDAMGTEIAFTNNGGIRASIDAGEITMREVYTVLPFGNFIVKMNLKGSQVRQALEYSYNRRKQLDLQTSGLTYRIVGDQMEIMVNGEPLDPERVYSVALQDFLASGGSGYPFPQFGTPVDQAAEVDAILVAQYIQKIGTVNYPDNTGRIQLDTP